jgi:Stage II sporulation protein E (SpoIIE)
VLARVGVAAAIFATVAVILLAGGSDGPLTDAEAQKGEPVAVSAVAGDTGDGEVASAPESSVPEEVAPPEDVAPAEDVASPAEELAPPAEPTPPAEAVPPPESGQPVVPADPASEESGGEGDHGDHSGDEKDPGGHDEDKGGHDEDPGGYGEDKGGHDEDKGGHDEDPGGYGEDKGGHDEDQGGHDKDPGGYGEDKGGHDKDPGYYGEDPGGWNQDPDGWGGNDGAQGPNFFKGERPDGWPAGGAKDPDWAGEPTDGAAEPAPAGRPQVVQPVPTAGSSADPTGDDGSGDQSDPVGTGQGELSDLGDTNSPTGLLTATLANRDAAGGSTGGTGGDPAGGTAGVETFLAASDTGSSSGDSAGTAEDGQGNASSQGDKAGNDEGPVRTVTKTVDKLVSYVPDGIKAALAALAALSILLGVGYLLAAVRAKRLGKQRRELLQEVGLLQSALLPPVPEKVGALLTSVAYRPADGPGAGGDFYDVLPLPGGRVGFILGDVSGHGRGALARTAFMRYTLRAYLEAGLEPRVALQVAGRVIDDNLGGDFATVLLAVHDPETGSLTYATAGHPAPIVAGPQPHHPVTAGSSPPIGVGVRTGLRQTTVPLVPGSVACLFTDGLMEARTADGILGRERLAELLDELGDGASARGLIDSVAAESTRLSDDMAAVIISPTAGVTAGLFRTEQLELSARELEGPIARRFLEAAGLPPHEVEDAEHDARLLAERFGGVVLHVVFGNRLRVEVLPRNVESIEAASRRVSAGTAR